MISDQSPVSNISETLPDVKNVSQKIAYFSKVSERFCYFNVKRLLESHRMRIKGKVSIKINTGGGGAPVGLILNIQGTPVILNIKVLKLMNRKGSYQFCYLLSHGFDRM